MPERLELRDLALPVDCDIVSLMEACPGVEALRFGDGELLIRSGEMADDIYLLFSGSCAVERPLPGLAGRQGMLAVLHAAPDAPVFVGEMAYLGSGFRTATVRSAMTLCALRLVPSHLDYVIDHIPSLTRVLCRQFATRLLETSDALAACQEELALPAEHVHYGPGEAIFEAGAPALTLYQLIDGVVAARSDTGEEETIDGMTPVFIEPQAYFRNGVYSRSFRAVERSTCLAMDVSAKQAVVRRFPELALELMASG